MRGALVRDDVVVNLVEYAEGWEPGEGYELLPVVEGMVLAPGWTRDGDSWSPPELGETPEPPPPPPTVEELAERLNQQQEFMDELATLILTGGL